MADLEGNDPVSLVVSDGHASSDPDQTIVLVQVPAQQVTITLPADGTIVTASPVIVTGTALC